MVPVLLAAVLVGLPQDTATFSDAATAELYARARVRHVAQDMEVREYRATVLTHWDATAGRSRFARQTPLIAHETIANITWSAPNDLRMDVLGARTRAPIARILRSFGAPADLDEELRRDVVMDRPWFIPRSLGDSIRVMGVPEHAALHPLAEDGIDFYRFAITDSVEVLVPGRRVRAKLMHVEPKRFGASLVAGDMWIDDETGDVVRFQMVFLGDYLWDAPEAATSQDSTRARKESREADRYLSVEADVEYALIDRRHWMPYRQVLAITVQAPWLVSVAIPVRAVTTFSDYHINDGSVVQFALPDSEFPKRGRSRERVRSSGGERWVESDTGSTRVGRREATQRAEYGYLRAGRWRDGRWEVTVPPADSLMRYEWNAPLKLSLDPTAEQHLRESFAQLAALEEQLPAAWTGRQRVGLVLNRVSDMLRFDRVQGLSLGTTVELRPGVRFSTVLLTARLGFADWRPTGSAIWRRDGPGGRLDLTAYRSLRPVEPWSGGLGVGNSLNALFVGHDDADYYLSTGGGVRYTWNYGPLKDVELSVSVEREDSVQSAASTPFMHVWGADPFPPNPAVTAAVFGRAALVRRQQLGPFGLDEGIEALGNDSLFAARAWVGVRVGFSVLGRTGALGVRAGATRGDSLSQLRFRLGGPTTVRGFPYGMRQGPAFWAAQLDLALARSGLISPVIFADAGDTFDANPLLGAGAGVSLLGGLVRVNFARALHPSDGWRFDLLFRAPR